MCKFTEFKKKPPPTYICSKIKGKNLENNYEAL